MLNRKTLTKIKLEQDGKWVEVYIGDEVKLKDGIYIGAEGSAVIYAGVLVAAWEGKNHVIPHGSPNNWHRVDPTHIDDIVAHIPLSSLQEGARRENLNWEKDCAPRIAYLLELLSLEIEPIHICMIACSRLKQEIKDGLI